MKNKVEILDTNTSNQIAAGEVVEKPASVVKELVENSLDAGATKIQITTVDGGTQFIMVADDGSGMGEDDARMAILPHATSKLRQAEDLQCLDTLGFRGEALPSIASVSNFDLITRREGDDLGVRIHVDGGGSPTVSEAGGSVGTVVRVENLFYNVPARRKFLKTVGTEARYISELLTKLSLSRPDVSFQYMNNDKEVLLTGGDGNLSTTILSLYGESVVKELLPVEQVYEEVRIRGFISRPTLLKNTRQWQTIFVNGRYVTNIMLSKAIEHAYQSMIPQNGFPFAVLFIDVDKSSVDVNVHPQKSEVKFSDEGLLYRALYHACLDALTTKAPVPAAENSGQQELPGERTDSSKSSGAPVYEPVPVFDTREYAGTHTSPPAVVMENWSKVYDQLNDGEILPREQSSSDDKQALNIYPIGQVDNTFIIAQTARDLYLIDQHAAHERILYDKLVENHEKVNVVNLLMPLYLDMDGEEVELLLAHHQELQELGLDLEAGGEKLLRINSLPIDIKEAEADGFIQEIILVLRDNSSLHPAELRRRVLHMAACKGAIKAGQELNMRQMRELIGQLLATAHPFTCPHGRPCMLKITTDELYKMFKRTGF